MRRPNALLRRCAALVAALTFAATPALAEIAPAEFEFFKQDSRVEALVFASSDETEEVTNGAVGEREERERRSGDAFVGTLLGPVFVSARRETAKLRERDLAASDEWDSRTREYVLAVNAYDLGLAGDRLTLGAVHRTIALDRTYQDTTIPFSSITRQDTETTSLGLGYLIGGVVGLGLFRGQATVDFQDRTPGFEASDSIDFATRQHFASLHLGREQGLFLDVRYLEGRAVSATGAVFTYDYDASNLAGQLGYRFGAGEGDAAVALRGSTAEADQEVLGRLSHRQRVRTVGIDIAIGRFQLSADQRGTDLRRIERVGGTVQQTSHDASDTRITLTWRLAGE